MGEEADPREDDPQITSIGRGLCYHYTTSAWPRRDAIGPAGAAVNPQSKFPGVIRAHRPGPLVLTGTG